MELFKTTSFKRIEALRTPESYLRICLAIPTNRTTLIPYQDMSGFEPTS